MMSSQEPTGMSRAEACRKNFTKHPRWFDADGQDHPFSSHPNYGVTRHVRDKFPEEIHPVWDTHYKFCMGVSEAIGAQPTKHHWLVTIEPGQQFVPDTVLWMPRPATTRRARYAVKMRADAGDEDARAELDLGLAGVSPDSCEFRRREARRQREEHLIWRQCLPEYYCECVPTWECDTCAWLARVGCLPSRSVANPEDPAEK